MNQVVTPMQPTIVAPTIKTPAWGGQGSQDLQQGIEAGNVEQVLDAVKVQGISVHDPLPNGELPLCFAAKLDLPDMAQELMKVGAKPDQKDSHGHNAIEHAAFLKKEKVFPCLIRAVAQAEVDAVNQEYPGIAGSMLIKVFRQNCLNLAQRQPSMLSSSICKAAYNGDLDALRAFDGDVDAPDWSGLTPVHYALLGIGGLAALDILISKGANVHFVTKSKESYLHFAALSGKPECVAKLCEHGLKVTKVNAANQSPLHYAMALTTAPGSMSLRSNPQYWSMYDALVQKGAKLSQKDTHGISPLHLIKMHLNAKNPADVRITDWILLGSSMAAWGTYLASQCGMTSEMPVQDVADIVSNSFGVHQLTELYNIIINGDGLPWLAGYFGFPMVGMSEVVPFYEAVLGTKQIAESFKYTRQNISYIGLQGWRNLAIHGANIVGSFAHAAVRSGMLPLRVYGAGSYQKMPQEPVTPPPENWKDLSEKERILHEGLDPTNPRHAEKILHCDKAKVDKYPTDAELEAREDVSGKLAQCKAYDSCVKETEVKRNEECEEQYQPAEMEEDSPAWERETQRLGECLGKPINPSRCRLEQGFWFDPDQCEAHQKTAHKVAGAYKSALKGCYRELAMKWHPDKNPDPDAEKVFPRIGQAWETVSS